MYKPKATGECGTARTDDEARTATLQYGDRCVGIEPAMWRSQSDVRHLLFETKGPWPASPNVSPVRSIQPPTRLPMPGVTADIIGKDHGTARRHKKTSSREQRSGWATGAPGLGDGGRLAGPCLQTDCGEWWLQLLSSGLDKSTLLYGGAAI